MTIGQFLSTQWKLARIKHKFGRQLQLAVDRTGSIRRSDILLVTCLRNELVRLPFFCDYYRKLGVNHFLIIDNNSTDGVEEWARSQPDVSLWTTRASYRDANFGMDWCNHLLRGYGGGHLCVTVDPDEFLIYPGIESRDLRDLGEFMRTEKRDALHCLMLDAYSDRPLSETVYVSGGDPFALCRFFDRDGYLVKTIKGVHTTIRGGPRMRLYYRHAPLSAPALNKAPVIWWRSHYRYTSSTHDVRPMPLMRVGQDARPAITGALMHFKFMASLQDKAAEEMRRKQHYNASSEYRKYAEDAEPELHVDGLSIGYEGPEQLIALGLMARGGWL